jgi:LmbE family N-acetylglucosaminyl deacetylase
VSTVVFFHAHPDDEAIFTGGTIARLADAGARVVVVIATSGELGQHHGGESTLAEHRADETRAACEVLGVARLEMLGYTDSGLAPPGAPMPDDAFAIADVDEAARRLAAIIVEEAATALVYYDEGGIYGHADHLAVHRVGRRAAELAGVTTVYESTVDREYLHFVETHLVALAVLSMHEVVPTGVPTVIVSTTIDVTSVIDRKRAAMAAHASQIPADSAVLRFDPDTFAGVYGYEWYVRTGPPADLDTLAM